MQVHTTDTTAADQKSAVLFFDMLTNYYPVGRWHALDMFARNGQLTVKNYFDKVRTLDVWELGEEHAPALMKFNPHTMMIGDSYGFMEETQETYDLVVIDSPQGIHKDGKGNLHVEHFDVVRGIDKLIGDHAVVVLYVNKKPYDPVVHGDHGYDRYVESDFQKWMDKRMAFYRCDPFALTEEIALRKYSEVFHSRGYAIQSMVMAPCFSDVPDYPPYSFRVAFELVKGSRR